MDAAEPIWAKYEPDYERTVIATHSASLGVPDVIREVVKGKFICFCALDARPFDDETIAQFCSILLRLGCAYFSVWGPDCERVHDIMDRQAVGAKPSATDLGCVMTTWHSSELLEDAAWFFLRCAVPDEDYAPDGCRTALAIAIGPDVSFEQIRDCVGTIIEPDSSAPARPH